MTSCSEVIQKIVERYETNDLLKGDTPLSVRRPHGQDLNLDHPTMRLIPEIIVNASEALERGHTHYVPEPGIEPLRDALGNYFQTVGLSGYEQSSAFLTAGVQESRFLAVQVIGPLFGGIAMPEVVDPGVRKAVGVRKLEIRSLAVDRESGMLATLASIRDALSDGYRLLYLESPVRLTGAAFGAAAVEEIAGLIEEFDASVVWDQGLAAWADGGEFVSLGSRPRVAERVVSLGEAWPGLELDTQFVGYLAVNEGWLERIRALKQSISICTSTASQFLALETARRYETMHNARLKDSSSSCRRVRELVNELGLHALPGITVNAISLRVEQPARTKVRLREEGFSFADGTSFGVPDALRLAVSTDETTAEAIRCISEVVV